MCSKTVSQVKMWSREGIPSAESMSLPLVACYAAQAATSFSTFCVSAEGFLMKHVNCNDSLSPESVLCLAVLVFAAFLSCSQIYCVDKI